MAIRGYTVNCSILFTDLPLDDEIVRRSAQDHLDQRPRPHGIESWSVASGTGVGSRRAAPFRSTRTMLATAYRSEAPISSTSSSVTVRRSFSRVT